MKEKEIHWFEGYSPKTQPEKCSFELYNRKVKRYECCDKPAVVYGSYYEWKQQNWNGNGEYKTKTNKYGVSYTYKKIWHYIGLCKECYERYLNSISKPVIESEAVISSGFDL
jgi:hypothetical protein